MMNTECVKLFNENDVEIHENGISLKNTFFSKGEIATAFNELILFKKFNERHG